MEIPVLWGRLRANAVIYQVPFARFGITPVNLAKGFGLNGEVLNPTFARDRLRK